MGSFASFDLDEMRIGFLVFPLSLSLSLYFFLSYTVEGFLCLVAVQLFIGGCQHADETHATLLLIVADVDGHLHRLSVELIQSLHFAGLSAAFTQQCPQLVHFQCALPTIRLHVQSYRMRQCHFRASPVIWSKPVHFQSSSDLV